jgi:ATP adenylyltransferase
MQNLWAPWRSQFVLSKKEHGCIFCQRLKQKKDKTNLILHRSRKCFIIMNRFPYNSGHLMVAPIRHIGEMEKLDDDEMLELMHLVQLCIKLLKKELKPQGFNLGVNLGKIAGAGIADHLHIHIVPRWEGDTNFMPILGKTKVVSIGLEEMYERLKRGLKKIIKK